MAAIVEEEIHFNAAADSDSEIHFTPVKDSDIHFTPKEESQPSPSLRAFVPSPDERQPTAPPAINPDQLAPENNPQIGRLQEQQNQSREAWMTPEQHRRINEGGLLENALTAPPGIEAPMASREDILKRFPTMTDGDADIVAGVLRSAAKGWNTVMSPVGIATAPAVGAGGAAGKAILGGFVAGAVKELPGSVQAFHEAMQSGEPGRIAEAASDLAQQSAVIFGGSHAVREQRHMGQEHTEAAIAEDARQAGLTESARALDELAGNVKGAPDLATPDQSAIAGLRPSGEALATPEPLRKANEQQLTSTPGAEVPEGMVKSEADFKSFLPREIQLEVSDGVTRALENIRLSKQRAAEVTTRAEGGQLATGGQQFRSIADVPGFEQGADENLMRRGPGPEPTREVPEVTMDTPLKSVEELVRNKLEQRDWANAVSTLAQTSPEISRKLVDKLLGVGEEAVPLNAGQRLIFEQIWNEALKKSGVPESPLPESPGLIDRLEALKIDPTPGVFANPFPEIAKAVWNTALDLAISGLRAGAEVKHAIDTAVAHIKKNASGFDESKVREYLGRILAKETPQQRAKSAQLNDAIQQTILKPKTPAEAKAMTLAANRLAVARDSIVNFVRSDDIRDFAKRTLDAADNIGRIRGEQAGNSLRLDLPDARMRNAATFALEANGDKSKLADFMLKVKDRNKAAERAVSDAFENWDALQEIVKHADQIHDEQLRHEQANGVDPGEVEAYVRHAYDMDAMIGRGRPVILSLPKGGAGVGTSFKKQRTFATYPDAIAAGMKPKTFDLSDLAQSRITMGQRLVNRTQWAEAFQTITDPSDGRPITTAMKVQTPKGTRVAPMGYTEINLAPGISVAVHEGYADLFRSLTGQSAVQRNMVARTVLNSEMFVKHGFLLLDTFHAGRMIYKALALHGDLTQALLASREGHEFRGLGAMTHDLGRSLLEYSEADLDRAVKANEITEEAAAWTREARPDAEKLIAGGLNVGNVSDALYKNLVRGIPGIGDFNQWTFEKLTRGAMMQAGISELRRMREALPDKSDAELVGVVAKNVNAYFGNLGRQGLFYDPTFQDLARMIFLAPQWVEGMARTELGAIKQLAGAGVQAELSNAGFQQSKKPVLIGTLAKGVGTGVLAMLVANQFLNHATRGQWTWQNPEEGHKLDAWIPGGENGFWISPLSVFAELSHDAYRYYNDTGSVQKSIARILDNKLSPLAHAAAVLKTGKDWMGRDLGGTWNTVKEAGKAIVPLPLPAQPLVPWGRNAPPGSLERQIVASGGIKIEAAQSATAQLYGLARQYMSEHGMKEHTSEPSDYRDLNLYLRKEDWKNAGKEFTKLSESKSSQTVLGHYANLGSRAAAYTGKRATDAQFLASLSKEQSDLVGKAKEEQIKLKERFFKMLEETKPKK